MRQSFLAAALAVAACLGFTTPAAAQPDPPAVVTPDPPPIARRVADLEARVAALEGKTAAVATPVSRPAAPTTPVRAAGGHTHTCSKGHTWDHSMDGGSHRCPTCSEYQNVQDPPGRSVVYTPGPSYSAPAAFGSAVFAPAAFGSGCSAAGCSTGFSAPRRGVFGGVFRR